MARSTIFGIQAFRDLEGFFYVKGSVHRIRIPGKVTGELALFLGLLWGDGWLVNRESAQVSGTWRVGIVGNDPAVIETFLEACVSLFNVRPLVCDRITKTEAYVNNRILYELLARRFGMPTGEKIGKLRIPVEVCADASFLRMFLRGLFSTDGTYTCYNGYPRVAFYSATPELARQVAGALEGLGFRPRIAVWNKAVWNPIFAVRLNGKAQVSLFEETIGFIGMRVNRMAASR